ncbi:MAG: putative DNA-binding domain-containing protein [Minwuia sp.]|uniref:HvfC/BufC family peptide modification chaperone n=1 Tax=Minwuia sp. TaxID=2493630 RepID=UPI003A85D1A9
MTSLTDLQTRFAAGVTGDASDVLGLAADDGRQADRFEIYRNNTFASLKSVLEDAFPTVAAILGEGLFPRLSAAFVRNLPPRANHLLDYGSELPDFIRRSEPLAHLPWLGDVAELDWAVNAAYGAADAASLTPDNLAGLSPEELVARRLPLLPSAVLIRSDWPVHAIRMNPVVGADPDRIARRAESVLIIRPGAEVVAVPVAPAEHAFLSALHEGQTLGEAAAACQAADPAFDLQGALARHLAGGHFAASGPDSNGGTS